MNFPLIVKKKLLCTVIVIILSSGCSSLGKPFRIGFDDGSDRCYPQLQNVDEIAVYYKDTRIQEIMKGTLIGSAVGAAGGVGVSSGLNADKGTGAIIGALVGGLAGGYTASTYWDTKLKQANNNKSLAISAMNNDMRIEIQNLEKADRAIEALLNCRTGQRDQIRREFSSGRLKREQTKIEWQKWADLIEKDKKEMQYLGDAIQNMKSIEAYYQYASDAIENDYSVNKSNDADNQDTDVHAKYTKGTTKKKSAKKSKHLKKHSTKSKTKKSKAHPQSAEQGKYVHSQPKTKALVSSVVEKIQSVEKKADLAAKLQQESANPNGFEQINGALPASDWQSLTMKKTSAQPPKIHNNT